jgi:iron complex transport system ATP-binding protein
VSLRCDQLSFWYRPGHPVLDGLTVQLVPGALTCVLGPNAAGKSTLVRLLLGTLTPRQGTVRLGDADPRTLKPGARAARIAYIPQSPSLAEDFCVRQVVELGRIARGPTPASIDRALERTELTTLADVPFAQLSAGQQQRVAMARVLAQLDSALPPPEETVILADEPFSAMDPRHAVLALATLREEAQRGRTVVVVMHDLSLAARLSDQTVLLSGRGELIAHEATSRVMNESMLSEAFQTPMVIHRREGEPVAVAPALPSIARAPAAGVD